MKLALASSLALAASASAFQATTTRASISTAGAQGNDDSLKSAISADGRFVAFYSDASNLVAGDTNGYRDAFVRDRQNGATERANVDSGGAEANDATGTWVSISADGRFVAFSSLASNLVAGDTNGYWDVFVRDRQSGTTERVSVDSGGAQGNFSSTFPSISADGRVVVFISGASNLVAGDTNADWDVFAHDRQLGTTELVSVSSTGTQGNIGCFWPKISADGRFVAFGSDATNLVAGDTNGWIDIFVHDRQLGTTERVSVSSAGVQGNFFSDSPSISADGRFVAFASLSSNLVAGDTNSAQDVFVRDRQNGTTERVSISSAGPQAGSSGGVASISADGRFVAFTSGSPNLVAGDTNGSNDIFVHDRQLATTERVSVSSNGAQASGGHSTDSSISADGRFVVFMSEASNLVAGDTNGNRDIFVRDRAPGPGTYCTAGTTTNGCSASIAASANPNVAHSLSCVITIANVKAHTSGIVFYGLTSLAQPWCPIGGSNYLCVKPPVQRAGAQSTGGTAGQCDGSLALDWNAFQLVHPLAFGSPWLAGDKAFVQGWFHDPAACGTASLSNAVELTYQP